MTQTIQNPDVLRRLLTAAMLAVLLIGSLQITRCGGNNDDYENAAADQHSRMYDQ